MSASVSVCDGAACCVSRITVRQEFNPHASCVHRADAELGSFMHELCDPFMHHPVKRYNDIILRIRILKTDCQSAAP